MQTIVAIAWLGLLLWVEPASAQKEYSLTVSIHEQVRPKLTKQHVEEILKKASNLLKETNQCDVTFKLDGDVKHFAPNTPISIFNEDQLEAVHGEPADVKVVDTITFCKKQGAFIGCAWRRTGPRSIIVTQKLLGIRHILWAHEFGHVKGLPHRVDRGALMTPCKMFFGNIHINQDECRCLQDGCPPPDPDPDVACTEPR